MLQRFKYIIKLYAHSHIKLLICGKNEDLNKNYIENPIKIKALFTGSMFVMFMHCPRFGKGLVWPLTLFLKLCLEIHF